MIRLAVASSLLAWLGAALFLARLRWFARPPLSARLMPYHQRFSSEARSREGSAASLQELVRQLASDLGERISAVAPGSRTLSQRLERIHSPITVEAFRTRQVGMALIFVAIGALLAAALSPPPWLGVGVVLLGPLGAASLAQARLSAASSAWQRRLDLELPVVTEQLGMLLGAGFSLGAAIARIAERGQGAAARDLGRVRERIAQGLELSAALAEWGDIADTAAVRRLVAVLSLHSAAPDLARLVSAEAAALRSEAHRRLLATLERREQQVWVPVTVAALVPGMILLAVPFIEALRLFALA